MNYKLESLNLTALTNAEAGDMVNSSLSKINTLPPAVERDSNALSQKYLPGLTQRYSAYFKAMKQVQENESTQEVAEGDRERDQALRMLRKANKLGLGSDVAAEKESARIVGIVLNKYKNIENLNYGAETENVKKLLAELNDAHYASHINALGLGRYITRVKNTNNAFVAIHESRATTTDLQEHFDAKTLCRDMLKFYSEMCRYIEAMANANDGGYYAQLLALVNGTRKQYADLLARRASQTETTAAAN